MFAKMFASILSMIGAAGSCLRSILSCCLKPKTCGKADPAQPDSSNHVLQAPVALDAFREPIRAEAIIETRASVDQPTRSATRTRSTSPIDHTTPARFSTSVKCDFHAAVEHVTDENCAPTIAPGGLDGTATKLASVGDSTGQRPQTPNFVLADVSKDSTMMVTSHVAPTASPVYSPGVFSGFQSTSRSYDSPASASEGEWPTCTVNGVLTPADTNSSPVSCKPPENTPVIPVPQRRLIVDGSRVVGFANTTARFKENARIIPHHTPFVKQVQRALEFAESVEARARSEAS